MPKFQKIALSLKIIIAVVKAKFQWNSSVFLSLEAENVILILLQFPQIDELFISSF